MEMRITHYFSYTIKKWGV